MSHWIKVRYIYNHTFIRSSTISMIHPSCTWRGRCYVCTWPRLAAQLTPCQDSRGHVQDPFLTKIFSLFPSLLWLSGRPLLGSLRTCTRAKTPPTILDDYFLENPWHLQELWCGLSLVRLEEWRKCLGLFNGESSSSGFYRQDFLKYLLRHLMFSFVGHKSTSGLSPD